MSGSPVVKLATTQVMPTIFIVSRKPIRFDLNTDHRSPTIIIALILLKVILMRETNKLSSAMSNRDQSVETMPIRTLVGLLRSLLGFTLDVFSTLAEIAMAP